MDPYAVLGLNSTGFTFNELSDAYRTVAKTAQSNGGHAGGLQRASAAFEVLSRDAGKPPAPWRGTRGASPSSPRLQPRWVTGPLARLKRVLQQLEKPLRQRTLQQLSKELRMELLKYMELSSIETPRSPGQPARKKGSCGLQRNRQGLFRAKINLEHISFYSAYTSASLAVEHHIFLVRLRQLVTANLKQVDITQAFQDAFAVMEALEVSKSSPSSNISSLNSSLHRQGIRTYLNIHAARWLGATHVTTPVLPFTQILELRKRLLMAREQGWHTFRAEWLSTMKCVGLSRSKKRLDPEILVDKAQGRVRSSRVRTPKRRRFAEQPRLALGRAVRAAEAAVTRKRKLQAHGWTGAMVLRCRE
mgnify:CR=1 FL=1|eukprot:symbB.v1.2.002158.t1/scaffold116.1/size325063/15